MSSHTTLRREYAVAMKQMGREPRVASTTVNKGCWHRHTKWITQGSYQYQVCTKCGEVLKEESK